ncbi:MAG: hypothetical protein H7840_06040 [Alphaproteobacteria bacterium]
MRPTVEILDVIIEEQDGLFVATCPTLPELLVAHVDIGRLMDAIPEVIEAIYHLERGMAIEVLPADAPGAVAFHRPWVAIPVHPSRQAVA